MRLGRQGGEGVTSVSHGHGARRLNHLSTTEHRPLPASTLESLYIIAGSLRYIYIIRGLYT